MATYWENSCSFGLRYVSWYKYLIVSLVFSHLGFWSGNLFLVAPFPDLCLLVPFIQNDMGSQKKKKKKKKKKKGTKRLETIMKINENMKMYHSMKFYLSPLNRSW